MKVIALNGSPRKNWNTATLLKSALKGAEAHGAKTELINIYDLDYKGCKSCFACKLTGGKSYAKCAAKDGLTPVLEKLHNADAVIFGSPIYFNTVTGEMRSLLERFWFPYYTYDFKIHFPKKIPSGFIYTMNIDEVALKGTPTELHIQRNEYYLNLITGYSETLLVTDTYQFEDYSKVEMKYFDPEKKKKRRDEHFDIDCSNALEMGKRFAIMAKENTLYQVN